MRALKQQHRLARPVVAAAAVLAVLSAACVHAATVVNTARLSYNEPTGSRTVSSNPVSTTIARNGYSVRGRLTSEQGAPVQSARVDARHSASRLGDVAASTLTGADGAYAIDGLAEGTYDICISGAGRAAEVIPGVALGPAAAAIELNTTAPAAPSWPPGLYMVAFPFNFATPAPPAVLAGAPTPRIASWAPASGRYVYYGQAADFPAVTPGVGYWLRVAAGEKLTLAQAGTPLPQTPCVVALSPGWNMVGNPFPAPAVWSSVQVRANGETVSLDTAARRNWVRPYGWTYRPATREYGLVHSSYRDASRVVPVWQACWVRALVNCELVIPPPAAGGSAAAADARAATGPSPEWNMQVVARVGQLRDSFNYLGVAAGSASNLQSPPHMSPYVDLSFRDGRSAGADLATCFTSASAGRLQWQFTVRSDARNAQVELTWPDLSAVPQRYRLTLVDIDANCRRYMRTTTAYVFNTGAAGGERHFRIEADPTPWARLQVSNLQQIAARASGVTVSYDVSSQALVDIEVRTLAGQSVRVLARGAAAGAGSNLVTWDGADSSGRMMPNGPYLCAISAVTEEGQAVKGMRTIVLTR